MKVAVCEQDETTSMKIVIHKFMNLNQSESDDELVRKVARQRDRRQSPGGALSSAFV